MMCSAPYWGTEERFARLDRCRRALFGDGLLTENENDLVVMRILHMTKRESEAEKGVEE